MFLADKLARKPLPQQVHFDRQLLKDNSACFRQQDNCPMTIYPPKPGQRFELIKNDQTFILASDNLEEIKEYVKHLIDYILGPGNYAFSIVDTWTEKQVVVKIKGVPNYYSKIHHDSFAPENYASADEFDNEDDCKF